VFRVSFERIIARCLRKDADRRFQTTSDVRLALEELKEESQASSRTGWVSRARAKGIGIRHWQCC